MRIGTAYEKLSSNRETEPPESGEKLNQKFLSYLDEACTPKGKRFRQRSIDEVIASNDKNKELTNYE